MKKDSFFSSQIVMYIVAPSFLLSILHYQLLEQQFFFLVFSGIVVALVIFNTILGVIEFAQWVSTYWRWLHLYLVWNNLMIVYSSPLRQGWIWQAQESGKKILYRKNYTNYLISLLLLLLYYWLVPTRVLKETMLHIPSPPATPRTHAPTHTKHNQKTLHTCTQIKILRG